MSRTKKTVDAVALTVSFSYADGGMRIYNANELPVEILNRLIVHGLSQKLGDSYAGRDDHEDCTEAVWENLKAGNWGAERGSGLEDRLAEAEERLMKYSEMTDEQKKLMAGMGVTRSAIEKEITSIEKAIARRDAKK